MKLYHKDVYMPKMEIKDQTIKFRYSVHAMDAAENDRYGEIELPATVNLATVDIFELETADDNTPIKVCFRMGYNSEYDLIVVMLLEDCKVKTVWLNGTRDVHTTLNRSAYEQPVKIC